MKIFDEIALLALVFLSMVSCTKNACSPNGGPNGANIVRLEAGVSCIEPLQSGTRSVLGTPSVLEAKISGLTIAVYQGGVLAGCKKLTGSSVRESVPFELENGVDASIYALVNMWKMSGGKAQEPVDAPEKEADMIGFSYLLKGGACENFADIAEFGIPASGSMLVDGNALSGSHIVKAARLLSKLVVTIDHTGIDGEGEQNLFLEDCLHIRQANARLSPFSDSRALSSDDILSDSDYEAFMTRSGHSNSYVFYVPENVQGSNSQVKDPSDKTPANAPSGRSSLVSYVEFDADVTGGGLEGDVRYQFCLGENNSSSFSVFRNVVYNVGMTFKTSSLFDEPTWKINPDIEDSRLFGIMKYPECLSSDALDCSVAVRAGRSGTVYAYLNENGRYGDVNSLIGRDAAESPDYEPSAIDDSRIYLDAGSLKPYGISASYDGSDASITVDVTDRQRFMANLGKTASFDAVILPGGIRKRVDVKLLEDISFASDLPLTEGFYVAMERKLSASGLCSAQLFCYDSYSGASLPSIKAAFGSGRKYPGKTVSPDMTIAVSTAGTASLSIYSYHENDGAHNCVLALQPSDAFNDGGPYEFVCLSEKPGISVSVPDDRLFIAGDYACLCVRYSGRDGIIRRDAFDDAAYRELLSLDGDAAFESVTAPFVTGDFEISHGEADEYGYPEDRVCIVNVPDGYIPSKSYSHTVSFVPAYSPDTKNTFVFTVPPLYCPPSGSLSLQLDDYSLMSGLGTAYPSTSGVSTKGKRSFSFGVREASDLFLNIAPVSKSSESNDCITATLSSVDEGYLDFLLSDPSPDNENVKHSVGKHSVKAYVKNRHSGQTVMSDGLLDLEVCIHMAVGANLELYDCSGTSATWSVWAEHASMVAKTSLASFDPSVWPLYAKSTALETSYRRNFGVQRVGVNDVSKLRDETFTTQMGRYSDITDAEWVKSNWDAQISLCGSDGNVLDTESIDVSDMKDCYIFHNLKDVKSSSKGWLD